MKAHKRMVDNSAAAEPTGVQVYGAIVSLQNFLGGATRFRKGSVYIRLAKNKRRLEAAWGDIDAARKMIAREFDPEGNGAAFEGRRHSDPAVQAKFQERYEAVLNAGTKVMLDAIPVAHLDLGETNHIAIDDLNRLIAAGVVSEDEAEG